MNSPIEVSVDRRVLAQVMVDAAVVDVAAEAGHAIQNIGSTRPLLKTLLEIVLARIPAKRGAILLAGASDGHLEPAESHPNSFNGDAKVADRAFQDRVAILSDKFICVPLWYYDSNLGAIYLDQPKHGPFQREHVNLLMAIAWEAASLLKSVKLADSLKVQNDQLSGYAGVNLKHGFVGKSAKMKKLVTTIGQVARTDTPVMIRGEMGTGKELIARAIHGNSRRAENTFLGINCATVEPELMANTLFGNERGGFTGAEGNIGVIEATNGGTLLLDEIGDIRKAAQPKLLRVLQEREFQRVGGTRTVRVDVRIISATNRNLEEAVENGEFRGDLYDRLAVFELSTTPLRETREDIPLLVDHFIKAFRQNHEVEGISPAALEILVGYNWPGNVRQLRNTIEGALLLHPPKFIEIEHLPARVLNAPIMVRGNSTLQQEVRTTEKAAIESALGASNGRVAPAALKLGMHERTLRRKITKYGIPLR
jgi:Nif-specific regulatory protein